MIFMEFILVVRYVKSLKMGKHVFDKKGKHVMQITIKEINKPYWTKLNLPNKILLLKNTLKMLKKITLFSERKRRN